MSCGRERTVIENLYNEKTRLEAIVTEFKSNNKEYLDKIRQAAYEEVKSILMNIKLLLQFALASVIESLRINPEICNFLLCNISTNTYGSTMFH